MYGGSFWVCIAHRVSESVVLQTTLQELMTNEEFSTDGVITYNQVLLNGIVTKVFNGTSAIGNPFARLSLKQYERDAK